VKETVAQRLPGVASIKFGPNTFPDSPIFPAHGGIGGHLIVIRGFTPNGNVIVNDPASRAKGSGVI
jgi:hypothetical protein